MVGKPELGTKCTCTGCHERFYNLNRSPAICPKCGVQQRLEKPRMLRPPPRSAFNTGSQQRRSAVAVTIDADAEPVGADESDAEDDASEANDEANDDNIENDPDSART